MFISSATAVAAQGYNPPMSEPANSSPRGLTIRTGAGALLAVSGILILYLAPSRSHAVYPSLDVLLLLIAVVLVIVGFLISYDATGRIEQGVSGSDWPTEKLEPLRRLTRAANWSTVAALVVIVSAILTLLAGQHRFNGLQGAFWALYIITMILNRLRAVLNPKIKPSNMPLWTDMKPIRSNHWGDKS